MKRNDESWENADSSARLHRELRNLTRACVRPGALAVLAAAVGLALAACTAQADSPQVASLGKSSGASPAPAHVTGNPTQVLDEWATCIRSHGDPTQTDPTIDSNKDIEIHMTNVSEALASEVHGSTGPCSNYLLVAENDLRGGQPAPTYNMAQQLKYAQCMRAHGVPTYPDPNGQTDQKLPASVDPNSPVFNRADKLCTLQAGEKYYPPGTEMPGVVIVTSCSAPPGMKCPAGPPGSGTGGNRPGPVPSGNGGSGSNG